MASCTEETRPCSVCGKQMIQRVGNPLFSSWPPRYSWQWECACGHAEQEEVGRTRWKAVNG